MSALCTFEPNKYNWSYRVTLAWNNVFLIKLCSGIITSVTAAGPHVKHAPTLDFQNVEIFVGLLCGFIFMTANNGKFSSSEIFSYSYQN